MNLKGPPGESAPIDDSHIREIVQVVLKSEGLLAAKTLNENNIE